MKKFTFVLAAIVFCMAATQTYAQKWELRLEFTDNDALGGYIIQGVSDGAWFGNYDKTKTFIPGTSQTLRITQDSFISRYQDGVVSSIGKIRLADVRSVVTDYKVLYGNEYISVYLYGTTGFKNSIYRKDKVDGMFKPVLEIKNDGVISLMYDLGGGKVLLSGQFYQAIDKSNVPIVFNNAMILDIYQSTLSPIGSSVIFESASIGNDKSIFIVGQSGGFQIAYYNSVNWKNAEYQSLPFGVQVKKAAWFNKDLGYVAWRQSEDRSYRLAKLEGGAWTILGTMYRSPATLSTSYDEMIVTAVERFGDNLIISHTGTHFNDVPVAPVFSYNTKTGEIKNLPLPSGVTVSNFDRAYVKVVGDSIYFLNTNELLVPGRQRVWILLHDGTLPVKLESFEGRAISGHHEITWKTKSEQNVSHFELESSSDGSTFSKMLHVIARNLPSVYTEKVPAKGGQTFYRLKMVDKDGSAEYSRIIKIGEKSKDLTVTPNPIVGNTLRLQNLPQMKSVVIYNNIGQRLRVMNALPDQPLDVSFLPPGIYFLIVDGKSLRFVK